MKKTHAASVIVAVCTTVMWMGTSAFAASGNHGHARTASAAAAHANRDLGTRIAADHDHDSQGVTSAKCWTDRDRDDKTGRPTDHDGDESARCHTHHSNVNKCDGDHDSDDAGCTTSPSKCWTDRDRDDKTGRPTDHDGDESARCHTHHSSVNDGNDPANVNDGDHDSDDVTPAKCWTDRDRDDKTGRPTDHDGDVCGRG